MKHRTLFVVVFGLVLIFGVPHSSYLQHETKFATDLKLTVRASNENPLVGERFDLIVGVKNTGTKNRAFSTSFRVDTGYTQIFYLYHAMDGASDSTCLLTNLVWKGAPVL